MATCKVCHNEIDPANKAPERIMCLEPCYREYKAAYRKPRSTEGRIAATPSTDLAKHRKKQQFLTALLTNGGFMAAAIKATHTSREFVNMEYNIDPDFAAMFDAIIEATNERIEQEIYRRAVDGIDKPLVHLGQLTGETVKEYSDNLLMFLAKARMPSKYRDLPQKGSELTEEELNAKLEQYLAKRTKKIGGVEVVANAAAGGV